MLLARIYEINPLVCPRCGGEMKIIALITEVEPIGRILRHIGEPFSGLKSLSFQYLKENYFQTFCLVLRTFRKAAHPLPDDIQS